MMNPLDIIATIAVALVIALGVLAVSSGYGCDDEENYYNRNNRKK